MAPSEDPAAGRIEHNEDKLDATYALGRRDAMKRLKEIEDFMR